MVFNENSFLVQLYVRKINEGIIVLEDVPDLFNLYEVVDSLV